MKNKITTIITGSNSGIGKKSLLKFIQEGHHVIMGCRDMESGERAREYALKNIPGSEISLYKLDLSDFSSVKQFANEVERNFPYVNNIIHNAGVFNHGEKKFQITVDGYELTYQVNLLSPYLLNQYLSTLLDKSQYYNIKENQISSNSTTNSDPSENTYIPKIIYASTTNIKYFFDPKREVNPDDMKPHNRPYNSYKMYGDSKICQLALVFMDTGLPTKIHSNAIMIPAVKIDKRTRKRLKPFYRFMAWLQYPFALDQEVIAEGYFYLTESNLDKTVINSKKEIVIPVGYSDKPLDQIQNIISDRTFPNYCMQDNLLKSLHTVLEELKIN